MYAIMGASGHIGHEMAKNLLNKGEKVRVICRSQGEIKGSRSNRQMMDL